MLPTIIGIDMIMSMLLIIPLRTQIRLITRSCYINPLNKKILRLRKKNQVPRLCVCLFLSVRLLNRTKAEPSSEGHSVLFVEPDCLSPSLCWCKLNRLIFLSPIKYSSQLDLAVCINVINYNGGEKQTVQLSTKMTKPCEKESFTKKKVREKDAAVKTFKMFFFFNRIRLHEWGLFFYSALNALFGRDPSQSTMWIVPAPLRKCHNYRSQTEQNTCGSGPLGDKQPTIPSQCTDPSHSLHYWERKHYQVPANKHLVICRVGIAAFYQAQRGKSNVSRTCRKQMWLKRRKAAVLLALLPSSLWPLGPALPLIWLLSTQL